MKKKIKISTKTVEFYLGNCMRYRKTADIHPEALRTIN